MGWARVRYFSPGRPHYTARPPVVCAAQVQGPKRSRRTGLSKVPRSRGCGVTERALGAEGE
jgi:hypothetical protein